MGEQEQQEPTAAEVRVTSEGFSSAAFYSAPAILHSISNAAAAHTGSMNPTLAGGQWGNLCSEDQN